MPEAIGSLMIVVLRKHADAIAQGAIVTIEPGASRVRILPVK
jgi:hypothetical protein